MNLTFAFRRRGQCTRPPAAVSAFFLLSIFTAYLMCKTSRAIANGNSFSRKASHWWALPGHCEESISVTHPEAFLVWIWGIAYVNKMEVVRCSTYALVLCQRAGHYHGGRWEIIRRGQNFLALLASPLGWIKPLQYQPLPLRASQDTH